MRTQPKILVIDDEQIICESLKRILSSKGYQVDSINNPLKGLDLATSRNYSMVFLDLRMEELNGIDLLNRLRDKEPDLPVVIITGYPSLETAIESVRLHASDYLSKPFTPEDILQLTKRIITEKKLEEKNTEGPAYEQVISAEWKPSGKPVQFYETAWLEHGLDDTFRIGSQLPDFITRYITDLELPKVNDIEFQGLPLAAATVIDKIRVIIPSPVSGRIIEVNPDLKVYPYMLKGRPFNETWIVRIVPSDAERDLRNTQLRRIVLLSRGDSDTGGFKRKLTGMGYRVHLTEAATTAINALKVYTDKVIFIDAGTFNVDGPSWVKLLHEEVPDVKVVIIGNPDSASEEVLRSHKVFYYCLSSQYYEEINDILYSIYTDAKPGNQYCSSPSPGLNQRPISKIHISYRQGGEISLLVFGNLMNDGSGIGSILLDKLSKGAYQVKVKSGTHPFLPEDPAGQQLIAEEKENSDLVITYCSKSMERIPGQVQKHIETQTKKNGSDIKVINISVQANKMDNNSLVFNNQTTRAIADLLFDEIISNDTEP